MAKMKREKRKNHAPRLSQLHCSTLHAPLPLSMGNAQSKGLHQMLEKLDFLAYQAALSEAGYNNLNDIMEDFLTTPDDFKNDLITQVGMKSFHARQLITRLQSLRSADGEMKESGELAVGTASSADHPAGETKTSSKNPETHLKKHPCSTTVEQHKMTEALELKEDGNKAFKAGNIHTALGAYSYSLKKLEAAANSDDASQKRLCSKILSNRALCWAKIGEHNKSLTDAESAIACDSSFAKGYLRKAQALLALKRPKEAIAATLALSEMDKDKKITKSVMQLTKKCNHMITLMITPRAAAKNGIELSEEVFEAVRKAEEVARRIEREMMGIETHSSVESDEFTTQLREKLERSRKRLEKFAAYKV